MNIIDENKLLCNFKEGINNRYSLCCIIHYSLDGLLKRQSALLRGIIIKTNRVYVPCVLHKKQSISICDDNGIMIDLTCYFGD